MYPRFPKANPERKALVPMVTFDACRAVIQRQQGLCQPTREEGAIEVVKTVSQASVLPSGGVEGKFFSYDTFDLLTRS